MRGIDLFSFFRATRRIELFAGACDPVLTAEAEIELVTPAVLSQGVSLGRLQGTGTITADTADFPCPSFEVVRTEVNPLRIGQTDAGALIAEAAERIDDREVRLVWEVITDAEREAIESVWDGGLGLFRPFGFTVPGEASPRRFVFRDPELALERRSARNSRVEVTLVDVGAVAD